MPSNDSPCPQLMLWEFPVLPLLLLLYSPLESRSRLYFISRSWKLNDDQTQEQREQSHGNALPETPGERRLPVKHRSE